MSPTLELITSARLAWATGIVFLTLLIRFWQKLHFQRSLVKGLPGPPHSYLWGSLRSMGEVVAKQPFRAAPQCYHSFIQEHYKLGDWFVLDTWPIGPPMIITFSPEMAHEFIVKHSAPKHPLVDDFMQNFGGTSNLVSAEGAVWKKWRSIFNPGFSATHLQTQVPDIVDECEVFCTLMAEHARSNDLFRMETATTLLTVDIIGRVVLATSLNSQREPNELVSAFNSQTRWQPVGVQWNPLELIDLRIPFVQAWNNYRMDRFIGHCLDERIASRATREKQDGGKRDKHVVDLAFEAYLKEKGVSDNDMSKVTSIDPAFRKAAIANAKTFVFAGHDTTSSTICYAYYYLSKNPDMLARIRAEHDEIFGPDPSDTATLLKKDANLLKKLEYTTAVIKEVLRFQPPASSIRIGEKGFFLHDPQTGEPIPTEHFMLWPVDVGLHRNPTHWPNPHLFDPTRFLAASNNSSNPAYVPFSKGPRNCIGQELALIESKIILAMTMRSFDFASAYDEVEKLKGDGTGYPSDVKGLQSIWGEEAYQVQKGTAKPREGMPCRLRARG